MLEKLRKRYMLEEGDTPPLRNVFGEILKIGLPSTAEMIFSQTMSMIDLIMVGTVSSAAIASVGMTQQPFFILLTPFAAMNTVVGAVIARRMGEDDREGAENTLRHILLMGLVLSSILAVLGYIFSTPILRLVGTTDELMADALAYFEVIALGLPFQATALMITSVQRGSGNTKIVMKTNIAGNVVNVVMNFLLIGGNLGFPALGVRGAALGTVMGNFSAMMLGLIAIMGKKNFARLEFKTRFKFDFDILKNITRLGAGASVDMVALRIGLVMFTRVVSTFGTAAITMYQIGTKITPLIFGGLDGFNVAVSSLIGRSLGERRADKAVLYSRAGRIIVTCVSAVICVFITVFGEPIVSLFTKDEDVLALAGESMRYISVVSFTYAFYGLNTYVLRGAGDVMFIVIPSIVGVMILRPILCSFLSIDLGLGLAGAWISMIIDQTLRALILGFRIAGGKWKNKRA